MPRSTRLFLFPDINVWIALTYRRHIHHSFAIAWLEALPNNSELFFCRFTQLGFLRLLTTSSVMSNEMRTQTEAWEIYDEWLSGGHAAFVEEPLSLEPLFRSMSHSRQAAPKDWADSYLSAFAQAAGFCLVTFDRSLGKKTTGSLILPT